MQEYFLLLEELLDDYIKYQHERDIECALSDKILIQDMLADAQKKIDELSVKLENRKFAKFVASGKEERGRKFECENFDDLSTAEQLIVLEKYIQGKPVLIEVDELNSGLFNDQIKIKSKDVEMRRLQI